MKTCLAPETASYNHGRGVGRAGSPPPPPPPSWHPVPRRSIVVPRAATPTPGHAAHKKPSAVLCHAVDSEIANQASSIVAAVTGLYEGCGTSWPRRRRRCSKDGTAEDGGGSIVCRDSPPILLSLRPPRRAASANSGRGFLPTT